jgi:hypothetical protein
LVSDDSDSADRLQERYAGILVSHDYQEARSNCSWALVRPDGYIAASGLGRGLGAAERYMENWVGSGELERPLPV